MRAVELHDEGWGRRSVASLLGDGIKFLLV